MNTPIKVLATTVSMIALAGISAQVPFGTTEHQAYGDDLWEKLTELKLAGSDSIMSKPYEGTDPHGMVLVTLESTIEVNGDEGAVIIKRNYGGTGVSIEAVSNDPEQYLMATTVMFKRDGFDPQNNDWFWAKYLPDGSYDKSPDGQALAGSPTGCISCHNQAPGNDMVYLHDRH